MGSGKKKQLYFPVDGGFPTLPNPRRFDVNARNLTKTHLGGVIFGCTNSTFRECLSKQLFGLPSQHFAYVKNIDPGLPLFLFNYSDRKLCGIFEAASSGKMNIDPYGWTDGGSERTQYPAQVQTYIRLQCQPLQESQFRPIIADNYYSHDHFWFELDHAQTNKLISALSSLPVSPSAFVPRNVTKQKMIFRALPSQEPGNVGERIRPSVSEAELSNYSNQKSDSTNLIFSVDRYNQPSEAQLDAKEINEEEKRLVVMKLKQLTRDCEIPHLPLSEKEMDYDIESRTSLEDTIVSDELVESHEKKEVAFSLSDCQSMVNKLIQEVQGLKDYITQQDQKVVYLEQKMVDAEVEIQNLKRQLTQTNSLLTKASEETVLNSLDKVQLDPDELTQPNFSLTKASEETVLNSSDKVQLDLDKSIFLIGGYNSALHLSSLDSYYPSADVIKSCRPMSCIRSYACVVRLSGELYVFGGGNGHVWYSTVESYNQEIDRWTCRPSLNKERGNLGGAAIDNKIFALGGGNGNECFSDVEMLDLDLGRWIPTRSMLQKRFALSVVELNGVIYATGGYDGSDYLNSAERFDPREHSWCKIPCMTARRGCHSLVVFDEKLYSIGGFDGSSMVSSIEIYDPRLGMWIAGEPMKNPRGYAAAVALKESIHIIGGVKATDALLDTVETYREGLGWQETCSKAIGKRCFLSAIV